MAISVVVGTLGAGKTVYAVREAIERVAMGGRVFTNVEMNPTKVKKLLLKRGVYMRQGQITRLPTGDSVKDWLDVIPFGTADSPILVTIDETQLFYNARDYAKTDKENRDQLSFLTQSRKAHVDFIFVSQDEKNIDSQFRRIAEIIVTARNMAKIKMPILGLKLKGFFHYTFTEVQTNHVFERKWWKARSEVFECYNTDAFLDDLLQGLAETKEALGKIALRPVPWQRKLVASLEAGDSIERFFGRKMRKWAAHSIRKQRSKHRRRNENNSDPPGRGRNGHGDSVSGQQGKRLEEQTGHSQEPAQQPACAG